MPSGLTILPIKILRITFFRNKFRIMKIRLTTFFAVLFVAFSFWAQQPIDEAGRSRILSEMRAYKHRLLAKELDLSKEQQNLFFPVYDEMDDRLMQINNETRDLEKAVKENADASDTEIEAAAAAVYSQKEREGKVESEYFEKFSEILTPRQLLGLKSAEKKFTQKLVRHHHKLQRQQ